MEQNQSGQTGMVFYNYNPVDGTLTSTNTAVQIEFGSADVARQINQQVQLQYSNLQGIQSGQTQQIVITSQPTYDTTEDIDPILIKGSKTKIRSNGERVPCEFCGKTFSCNANLRDHVRLHTGERPFQCSECGMTFAQRSNWRLHKRVHTGERPYMCGICGKTFSRSSHLPGHIRVHTGERPFQCNSCENSFSSSQALKNHIRTHTGEKPFECEHCSTTFTHSSTLSSHKKRCTGEKRKRGRPIGSGRRRRRSLNRPRGRPKKKGRFGRRGHKKTEEETLNKESNVKEELPIICEVDTEEINGTDPPEVVDISVNVLNSVDDKHELTDPLLYTITEANSKQALLCEMPDSTNGEGLLCEIPDGTNGEELLCEIPEGRTEEEMLHKITETNNGDALLSNITEANNADASGNDLAENSNIESQETDVKPLLGLDVIETASEAAGIVGANAAIFDVKPDISGDLRQEAAVAMTTLQHSVLNLHADNEHQTF